MKPALLMLAALAFTAPARAQTTPPAPGCPQVTISGQSGPPLNCLNQELRQDVQSAQPTPSTPLGASSSSNAVGTFNETGVAEQYGQNFGKSITPYRPPTDVYANPVHQ